MTGLGGGLTIAVPRGALFDETVELLSRLGRDTGEQLLGDRVAADLAGVAVRHPRGEFLE